MMKSLQTTIICAITVSVEGMIYVGFIYHMESLLNSGLYVM